MGTLRIPIRIERRKMNIKNTKFAELITKSKNFAPIKIAVIFPDTKEAIEGVAIAAEENYVEPILLGDVSAMKKAAAEIEVDISRYQLIELSLKESIYQGVKMARNGEVDAIMKGSLHTDELMEEIVNKERGLRTDRRMSHCMLIDVPVYKKLFIMTDVALNIYPKLNDMVSIVQNSIDLAKSLGVAIPKVALLSAIETVTDRIPTTLEYAEVCKMVERGQIKGGIVDGPLSFDLAVSMDAAKAKKVQSEVAGDFDVLVMPNLECGNILTKCLDSFAGATSLGVILGAKVPIVLTSRSASGMSRALSCMLAKFYVHSQKIR